MAFLISHHFQKDQIRFTCSQHMFVYQYMHWKKILHLKKIVSNLQINYQMQFAVDIFASLLIKLSAVN